MQDLRTTPNVGNAASNATAYAGEGAADRAFSCDGLAMRGTFALAGGESQGLLQLVRKQGTWKIDQRVHSRGRNDAGQRHAQGWIDIRDSLTKSTTFTGVAIAPKAQRNGQFLAVTVDRTKGTLVVLSGVGTSKPRAVGVLGSAALKDAHIRWLRRGWGGVPAVVARPRPDRDAHGLRPSWISAARTHPGCG